MTIVNSTYLYYKQVFNLLIIIHLIIIHLFIIGCNENMCYSLLLLRMFSTVRVPLNILFKKLYVTTIYFSH